MAERFDGALITAGMKVRAERRDRLFQLAIVHPDPTRSAGLAARLFTKAKASCCSCVNCTQENLGITAKGPACRIFQVSFRAALAAHLTQY